MNQQAIEKQWNGDLQINHIWLSIQGEGLLSGTRCIFIRLAGCNLQCTGCDTEYTVRSSMSMNMIIESCKKLMETGWIVITGGEPFRQLKVYELIHELNKNNYKVQIESNGTLFRSDLWDTGNMLCVSPKTIKISPKILPFIDFYKYIINHRFVDDDGLPGNLLLGDGVGKVFRGSGLIYVQPLFNEEYELNVLKCVDIVLKHGYKLSLQIHKLVGVE